MLISNDIDHVEKLITTTISGRIDYAELEIDQLREWGEDQLNGYSLLVDLRQLETEHSASDDSKEYAKKANAPVPPVCIAMLVTTDSQRQHSQAYITESYLQTHYCPCGIFDKLDKALSWIKSIEKTSQMHITNEHLDEEKLLITTVTGNLHLAGFSLAMSRLWGEGELRGYCQLVDLSEAGVRHLISYDLKTPAERVHAPQVPTVAILVKGSLQGRIAKSFIEGRHLNKIYAPIKIFEQRDEAMGWLKEQG
jgi:hypothetical protein